MVLTQHRIFQSLAAMHLRRAAPLAAAVTIFAAGSRAEAQVTAEQAEVAAKSAGSNLPPDSFGGELMFGKLDEDYFITLALRLSFDRENFGVGFQLPVRLRLIDRDPEQNEDIGGIVRREDWDELSDFLRVIRYVYVGQADKKGPYYVRAGELSGLTVGHGTIMYRYYNGIDQDVWHTGLNAAVNVGAFGVEAVVGDVVDPYLFGGRFTVRPLQLALGEGLFWEKLVVGASLIADVRAPFSLRRRLDVDPMDPAMTSTVVELDEDNHPVVDQDRALTVFGIDVGIELFSNEIFSITPYVDLNKMSHVDYGWGLHMGVLWSLRMPMVLDTFVFDARTEYRRVSGDYIGPYFNTTYEIERYQVLDRPEVEDMMTPRDVYIPPIPKLARQVNSDILSRNGVFFDLLAGFPSFVFVGGEFIDYDGGQNDGTLRLTLEVPVLEFVKFSGMYYRINISGMDDLFAIDDRSAVILKASIPIYYVFSANVRWIRVWRADPEQAGEFEAVDDYSVGIGFSLEF